jgi:long-chain acyl-CoA synthetase
LGGNHHKIRGGIMSQLRTWAKQAPQKDASVIVETGDAVTFLELDRRSNRVARLLASEGMKTGDVIAILLDNDLRFFEIIYGARRLGLYYTAISTQLGPAEARYILEDCGAKILFTSSAFAPTLKAFDARVDRQCKTYVTDGCFSGDEEYEKALSSFDDYVELPEAPTGKDFLYSSGTTGKPKGIKPPLIQDKTKEETIGKWVKKTFRFDENTIFLSSAPLYHSAPMRFSMRAIEAGGTAVITQKFDAEFSLATIEKYRVTHSLWVPTMFVRLLGLPDAVKNTYNLSSHRCAIHGAAPCPAEVREKMIEWWGPIIEEYYSGSEANGATSITSREWLQRKGSVGRAVCGNIHILDDEGRELTPGQTGNVYFSDGPQFIYHNDPEKTALSRNDRGWTTIGDVGYVDSEGYLYLTDRKAYTIISGGINIYPQEVENVLITHPDVADVAVFGVPNQEYGEEVKAVVQLKDPTKGNPALVKELIEYCRARLSHVKCPRSVDFHPSLPRLDTGKIHKSVLKEMYWKGKQEK